MAAPHRFVIVESREAEALLLSRTLKRKFPEADLVLCPNEATLASCLTDQTVDLFVIHRFEGQDGLQLVAKLKASRPQAALILVSGRDRRDEALAAGADAFLASEEWLTVGTLAERLLAREQA